MLQVNPKHFLPHLVEVGYRHDGIGALDEPVDEPSLVPLAESVVDIGGQAMQGILDELAQGEPGTGKVGVKLLPELPGQPEAYRRVLFFVPSPAGRRGFLYRKSPPEQGVYHMGSHTASHMVSDTACDMGYRMAY